VRLFIFILLCTHVDFDLMSQNLTGGIVVVVVFLTIARPLTVLLCMLLEAVGTLIMVALVGSHLSMWWRCRRMIFAHV
jgi:NhaP-type Na+/H+ or K+/H+ antiporter